MPYYFKADDDTFITKSFASDEDANNYGRATHRTVMSEIDIKEYSELKEDYE